MKQMPENRGLLLFSMKACHVPRPAEHARKALSHGLMAMILLEPFEIWRSQRQDLGCSE